MMKTKLLGALAIAGVGVMGLGLTNTGAWFTDQETTSVSATAATLSIDLGGTPSLPITVSNLLPGDETPEQRFTIFNDSNNADVKYRIRSEDETGDIIPKLKVRLRHGNCGDGGVILFETYNEVFNATNLNFSSLDDAIGTGVLEDNVTHCFGLSFFLAPNADNSFQGTSGSFNIVVDATQPENPGFNE